MDLQSIIALRKYISIADQKPGKIKLKFSMQVLSDNEAMSIIKESKGKSVPSAITHTRFNLLTRTVEIEYDTNSIVPEEFAEIITTRSRPRFDALAEKYMSILS